VGSSRECIAVFLYEKESNHVVRFALTIYRKKMG
jgi:hypothetical protein